MSNLSASDNLTWALHEIDDLWHTINNSPTDHVSHWISIASLIFAILGSISNLLSVIVLSRLSAQLSTFIYLTGLSLSDMITCMSIVMTHILGSLIQARRILPSIITVFRYVEIVFGALAAGSRVLSLWISTAVTMDRWILICYPTYGKTFCTLKRARIITRTLFLIAFLYSVPLFFEYEIVEMPSLYPISDFEHNSSLDDLKLNERTSSLVIKGYSDLARRRVYRWLYMFFNVIFVYTLPTMTIVSFNIQLIRALQRVKSRSKLLKQNNPAKKSKQQSKYSVTIMVITMVLTLLLCRSPTIVLWVLWSFEMTIKIFFDSALSSLVRRFHSIANLIAIINAATNFLPFCVFGQLFRAECLNIYCCRTITLNQLSHKQGINSKIKFEKSKRTLREPSGNRLAVNSEPTSSIHSSSNVIRLVEHSSHDQQHSRIRSSTIPLLKTTTGL